MAKRVTITIKKGFPFKGYMQVYAWKCNVCGTVYRTRTSAHECEIKHNPKSKRSQQLFKWLQYRSGGYFATG